MAEERGRYLIEFKDIPTERQGIPEIAVEEAVGDFREVALGFTREMAMSEAARCLSCRRCLGCKLCLAECHTKAIDFDQVGQDIELENIVGLMREAGVKKTILAARGDRKANEIADLAETYPEQIVAAVRTKSKHYQRNTNNYYKKLSKQLNSGRFNAMAELLLYHAQRGELAEEVVIYRVIVKSGV